MQIQHKHAVKIEKSICCKSLKIECDGQRLKQILINLMKNSCKFTFEGFVRISVRKSYLAYSKKGKRLGSQDAVEFEIADTGIGMTEET